MFTDIPLVQNVIPGRFSAVIPLFLGAMLAIVVDRTHTWATAAFARRYVADDTGPRPAPRGPWIGAMAGALALAAAAVGVWSMAGGVVSNVPISTQTVTVPQWFVQVAPHLPSGQVVLTYPAPFALFQSPEDWQAIDGMRLELVGGSGPESIPQRAGKEKPGQIVIADATFSLTGPPDPTDAHVDAVRSALAGWGVSTIVMPDPTVLPRYEVASSPGAALGLFTVATGRAPTFEAGAWVWHDVHRLDHPRSLSQQAFTACVSVGLRPTRDALARVPVCVMTSSVHEREREEDVDPPDLRSNRHGAGGPESRRGSARDEEMDVAIRSGSGARRRIPRLPRPIGRLVVGRVVESSDHCDDMRL